MDWPLQTFNWTRGGDSGGECGVPYSRHFTNPTTAQCVRSRAGTTRSVGQLRCQHQPGEQAASANWWSINLQSLHLVMLSSEEDWTVGSPQHVWLADDLAAVNRSETPFVVLATHRPFYTSGYGWLNKVPYNVAFLAAHRAAIEPLLQAYSVDLVIVGHVHKYERTCPMVGGGLCAKRTARSDQQPEHGTVHMVVGAAGEPFQTGCDGCSEWEHVAVTEGPAAQRRAGGSARQFAAPSWSRFRTTEFGWGLLTVHNSSALEVEYVASKDSVVHDSVWIVK